MTDFRDETKRWLANANASLCPYDAAYRNDMLLLSVVRQDGPDRAIDDNILERGFVHWRIASAVRAGQFTLRARATEGRIEFDPTEAVVRDGKVQATVRVREPHPERSHWPETNLTCRFRVLNSGIEKIETTVYGFPPLQSEFFAEATGVISASELRRGRAPDLLVITALKDELDAFIRVLPKAQWTRGRDQSGYPYHQTIVEDASGVERVIVAARSSEMGEVHAAATSERLIGALGRPRVLAMTGICAGHPGETVLGDIVVANRLFKFDEGKREAIVNGDTGLDETTIFHDLTTHQLFGHIKIALEEYARTWRCRVFAPRPKTYDHQLRYLLFTLDDMASSGKQFEDYEDHATECPSRPKVIDLAVRRGLVELSSTLRLTAAGAEEVKREKALHGPQRRVDASEPKVVIGAMGSSAMVQKDAKLFKALQRLLRSIRGVDMEAAAVGLIAHQHKIPFLVVKSVVDHADLEKNDNFRDYASEASASFLSSFLLSPMAETGLWSR